MATGSLEAQDFKAVESNKFHPIDLSTINRRSNYNVVLQFGALARWRKYGGRERKVASTATPGKVNLVHDPKVVYVDEPISGKELCGFIQSHNEWIELFKTKNHDDWRGHSDRQIMVLGYETTTDLTPDSRSKKVDADFLVGIVSSLVTKQFDEQSKTKSAGKT